MHTTKTGSSIACYEGAGLRIAGGSEDWEKSAAAESLSPFVDVG